MLNHTLIIRYIIFIFSLLNEKIRHNAKITFKHGQLFFRQPRDIKHVHAVIADILVQILRDIQKFFDRTGFVPSLSFVPKCSTKVMTGTGFLFCNSCRRYAAPSYPMTRNGIFFSMSVWFSIPNNAMWIFRFSQYLETFLPRYLVKQEEILTRLPASIVVLYYHKKFKNDIHFCKIL